MTDIVNQKNQQAFYSDTTTAQWVEKAKKNLTSCNGPTVGTCKIYFVELALGLQRMHFYKENYKIFLIHQNYIVMNSS